MSSVDQQVNEIIKDDKFTLEDVLSDRFVKRLSDMRFHKEGSRKSLGVSLLRLCNQEEKNPTQLLELFKKEQLEIYDFDMRSINDVFANFYTSIKDLAPTTQKSVINRVNYFFKYYKVATPDIGRINATPLEDNFFIPSISDIQRVLEFCSPRDKAIILLQCTSGMGTGELLPLKIADFKKGYDEITGITMFHPLRKKTQKRYYTFITREASNAVLFWLNEYNAPDTASLFGLEEHGIISMYQRLSQVAGYNKNRKSGSYSKIRSHNMRKYFNNTLGQTGMPENLINYLSGRADNKTYAAYNIRTPEQLKDQYTQYAIHLTINEGTKPPEDYRELIRLVQQQHADNQLLALNQQHQDAEMEELKKIVYASKMYDDLKNRGREEQAKNVLKRLSENIK